MLKEVGASGQISLGKKYAGQLFDMQIAADGCVKLTPVKVVPMATVAQEERAAYPAGSGGTGGGDWLSPERLAQRKAAAARSPAQNEVARAQWEADNQDAIHAMNQRMAKLGSMGRRVHAWRQENAQREQNASAPSP